jgi:LemA protein
MNVAWLILGGIVLIFIIAGLFVMGTYNNLVSLDQTTNTKWANVEAQYQRRVDLIPNIVATVKGTAGFEQSTLTKLSELRTQWQTQPEQRVDTANQIESAISKLLVVSENYPTLQATQAYRDLIVELEGTENRISFARGEFNYSIQSYNTAVKSFPANIIAGMFGFNQKEFFKATTENAQNAPNVDFNTVVG